MPGKVVSLSIEETNKLREKLGLAPLKTNSSVGKERKNENVDVDDGISNLPVDPEVAELPIIPGTNVRHKPAENLADKKKAEKVRERLALKKDRRQQETKLKKVKGLADSSGDEDAGDGIGGHKSGSAADWVRKQKVKEQERQMALKRAKMLEEMDDAFGVGAIVKAEAEATQKQPIAYSGTSLKGLKVEHSAERFAEGRDVVLTLKDSFILGDEDGHGEDVLVNVNLLDDEKTEKNLDNIKKARLGYNKFDVVEDDDGGQGKSILSHYDEEAPKASFTLDQEGAFDQERSEAQRRREEIRKRLEASNGKKQLVSLGLDSGRVVASDYLTQAEVEASSVFKKVKKKKKVKRRMLKADDLIDQLQEAEGGGGGGDPKGLMPPPPPQSLSQSYASQTKEVRVVIKTFATI